MTGILVAMAEVVMSWKCSMPDTAGRPVGAAPAGTASQSAAAAAAPTAVTAVTRETMRFNLLPFREALTTRLWQSHQQMTMEAEIPRKPATGPVAESRGRTTEAR